VNGTQISNAANMSLKLSFVSQFTFPKKLDTTILSQTIHSNVCSEH